jgi:hypothetical protein
MEIDITDFVETAEPSEFSASVAELGQNAGKITWANAKREAQNRPFPLLMADDRDEFEAWIKGFGAWEDEEIAAWSLDECNALLIQYISGDLRELLDLCPGDDEYGIDWGEARSLQEQGTISGNIYEGDDGRLYFYMGN